MRYMKAAEFKAKCLQVMEEVASTGEEIVVTKRGTPVARILPPPPAERPGPVGWGAGARFYVPSGEDLTGPIVRADAWDYDEVNLVPPGADSDDRAP